MKTNLNLIQTWILIAGALPIVSSSSLAATAEDSTDAAPPKACIPWSQVGARAGADYQGDGLAILPTVEGARLRCVFQRLEGEATSEGLWLTSTVTPPGGTTNDRFRIVAADLGRLASTPSQQPGTRTQGRSRFTAAATNQSALLRTGTVAIDGQTVLFVRPGLIEEYSVSMDGVRQDFVLPQPPKGTGQLELQMAVSGAQAEPAAFGAQLVLKRSGRKIAYSRLRVTDATGKELPARMEIRSAGDEVTSLKFSDSIGAPSEKVGLLTSTSTLLVVVNDAEAVYPIRIDPTFSDANWISMGGIAGANSAVRATVADASGNLYIGGDFTIAGNVFANHIAKWNGSSWSALGSGMNGAVYALAVSGSDLYAAGYFTLAGGSAANGIAKWNGSSWSALGSGMDGGVLALAVSGSDLYAGGFFATAGGSTVNNIAKWNGNSWSALGFGMDSLVEALAVSGSDVYVGGGFMTATNGGGGAVTVNRVAEWNGSSWSGLGSGVDSLVHALVLPGSDLYVAGEFVTATNTGGVAVTVNRVAKWNGSSWSALGSGMDGYVSALAVSGSDLYAGGVFTTATNNGGVAVPANYIAQWNGSSWSALGLGMNNDVFALAVSGGNLYVGGGFTTAGASAARYIANWNEGSWSALESGIGGGDFYGPYVATLGVSGSDLYAAGDFTTAGNIGADNIAKWNGSGWSGLGGGVDNYVYALAVSGSDVYAGGQFRTATNRGGVAVTANYIAKWNGSAWSPLGLGLNGAAGALAVSGTDLFVGGGFTIATNIGGATVAVNHIARWNGSAWSPLGVGLDVAPTALAVFGGSLHAAYGFTIVKWDGSAWSYQSGVNNWVYSLAVSGSDLYVGGAFTTATCACAQPTITVNHVAKWNGSSWSALGSGVDNTVYALAVSGKDLYAGGLFRTATNSGAMAITVNQIAKWNGSSWTNLGSGISGPAGPLVSSGGVLALALSGSALYAGGSFTNAGGKVSTYMAKAIVYPPFLTIEPDGSGGYFLRFDGVPGSSYRLQRAASLTGPWTPSSSQIAPASGLLQFWDVFPPPGQGFYRSVQP
jgi:hypothetical protein